MNKQVVGGPPEHAFHGDSARSAEITSMRTRTSRTFQNDFGALETEIFTSSIHYLHDGEWRPIDNAFEDTPAGYRNRANQYAAQLPKVLGAAPVRFGVGDDFVSLDLQGAAPVQGEATENRVEYLDALPGVDVVYEAFADQLKDSMMLGSAEAQSEFEWRLQHAPGLTPTVTPSGGVDFRNATGEIVTSIVPPLIHDAAGVAEGAAPPHAFTLDRRHGFSTLRLVVDEQWLAAPERRFPVTVDPTWVINAQKDCYIADGSLANNSFCGTQTIQVGRSSDGYRNRSLLRFDVGQFPNNAEVLNASLGLYLTQVSTANAPAVEVRRLTKNFVDGWATWQSPSGSDSWQTPGGDFTTEGYVKKDMAISSFGWKRWYVTRMVKDWIAKGASYNNGVIVKAQDESVTQLYKFSSQESSTASKDTRPVLVVTWDHGGTGDLPTYKMEQERLTERRERKVNVAGGNLHIHETDFKIKGIGLDLVFQRYYNSLVQADNIPTQTPLGTGWSLSEGGDVGLKLFHDDSGSMPPDKGFPEGARGAAFFGPSGYRLPFVKDASDGSFQRPPGLNANLRFDDSTQRYTLTFRATEERYVFSNAGTLLEHKDKNDNKIEFFYNANNKVSSIKDTAGRTTTFTYNAAGMLGTVEDPGFRKHQYGYDAQDPTLLRTYTDPSGAVTTYDYDQYKRLKSIKDAENHLTLYEYNDKNYVTKITEVTNPSAIPPTGDVTEFLYTTSTAARCPEKTSRNIRLSDMPLVTEVKDARQNVTTYCYNELSRVRLVKNAKNQTTYLNYNSDANITSYIDARDMEFSFSYDQTNSNTSGNLIGTTSFSDSGSQPKATSIEYDVDNDPSTVDHPGFPALVTDAQGNKTKYEYDDKGNLTRVIQGFQLPEADRIVFRYYYDSRGLLTWIEKPGPEPDRINYYGIEEQGNDVGYGYDANGNLTGINYSKFFHGRQYAVDDRFGDVSYRYDALGRVIGIYDGENYEHEIYYDEMDRITTARFDKWSGYNTVSYIYSYDKVGNLKRRENYLGTGNYPQSVSTFDYDVKNQPDTETHTSSSRTDYDFDSVGNLVSVVKDKLVVNPPPTTTYEYDSTNLLKTVVEPDGATTSFTYDSIGQRETTTFPNGVRITTGYNHSRDVKSIEAKNTNTQEVLVNLKYDYRQGPEGSRKDRSLLQKAEDVRTGEVTSYTYDAFNRLKTADTTMAGTSVEKFTYDYDKNSNVTSVRTERPNVDTTQWSFYGDVNEITCHAQSSTCGSGNKLYYHEGRGALSGSSATPALSLGLMTPYQTRYAQRWSGTQYEFRYRDMTQDEPNFKTKWQFYWPNYWIAERGDVFEHDLLGWERDRIGSETIAFLRDSDGKQLGQKVTSTSGGAAQKRYYVADRLGSIVAVTNGSGEVTKRYLYEPYGRMTETGTDSIHQPWRFAGSHWDKDLEVYHMGARMYEPTLRQFTQMDPMLGELDDPMTLNPYLYAGANPINNFDPTGRSCLNAALGVLGGAFAMAFGIAGIAGGILTAVVQPELMLPAAGLVTSGGTLLSAGARMAIGAVNTAEESDC